MNIVHQIESHPALAFVVGAIHLGFANALSSVEIPVLIMQGFQILAWSITITVGAISIYGTFKKWRKGK